jgi:hypothetical protein
LQKEHGFNYWISQIADNDEIASTKQHDFLFGTLYKASTFAGSLTTRFNHRHEA